MKNKFISIRALASLVILLFTGSMVLAQDFIVPDLDGFKKESNYPVYTPDDLWDYINGGADSYNALGFVDLNIYEYSRGKKNVIKLEVYRHINNDMAFGIYALERAPSYNFIDRGVQGYSGEGFENFFKGSYYIKIYTHSKSKKTLAALAKLSELVDQAIEAPTDFPVLVISFPEEGKNINEEMYVSENVMGHSFLSDAFRASYSVGDKSFIIYLFTRKENTGINEMVSKYLARQDIDSNGLPEGKAAFKDGYNGDIFLAWQDKRMVLISGLKKEDADLADSYISKILYK